MSSQLVESGLTVLAFSRKTLLGMLEDVPEHQWVHQPIPHANHAAWIAGHLAHTDHYFLTAVAGQPASIPAEWDELFGMGSAPTADAARYPSPTELRDYLGSLRQTLQAWFAGLDERDANASLPEELRMFAPTVGALTHSLAWHEGLHTGQLTVVRKSLGIAPKFG